MCASMDDICRSCFQARVELERCIIELHNRDETLARLQEKNEALKKKNALEKKKHTETNNEIIMSNVRYQQALSKLQGTVDKYVKDRENILKVISSKQSENAKLKVENEILKANVDRLYALVGQDGAKSNLHVQGAVPNAKIEPAPTVSTEEPLRKSLKKSTTISNETVQGEEAHEMAQQRHTTNRNEEITGIIKKEDEVRVSKRYSLRRDIKVDYTEPSLRKKLRREYTDPIIVKAVDDLYLNKREVKPASPAHDDKENVRP